MKKNESEKSHGALENCTVDVVPRTERIIYSSLYKNIKPKFVSISHTDLSVESKPCTN